MENSTHRFGRYCVATTLLCAAQSSTSLAQSSARVDNDSTLSRLIDGLVESTIASEHIPGAAVAVVRDGRRVFAKGYGFANVEEQKPVDVERTIFRIGSTTKLLTALAVMQLVDQGKLRLDDPVTRWVPTPKIETRFPPVRVEHLIDHTGGFDQIGDEARRLVWNKGDRLPLDRFLETQLRTIRPPGQAATYDTYGISLAGLVIERTSRQPYAEYMRRQLFEPLGMSRTFVEVPDSLRGDFAPGYGWNNGGFVRQRYEYYASTPASSVDATAGDMARLMIALLGDGSLDGRRLFSATTAARVRAPQHPERNVKSFSYGFWEDEYAGHRIIHHGGSMLGYEGELLLVPDMRIGVYLVYNRDSEAGGGPTTLGRSLHDRLLAHWLPAASAVASSDPLPIDTRRFAGAYAPGTYCHACYEGEGWAFGFLPIRAIGPGIIDVGGQRWRATDSLVFVSERNPTRRMEFTQVDGKIAYVSQIGFGTMRERLDDRFLDEALGAGWRERRAQPLVARVQYANEQWDACASTYLEITQLRPRDGQAAYFGGRCAREAKRSSDAIRLLQRAWELGINRPLAAYHLGAAYAQGANADSAFVWLSRAVELRSPRISMLDTDPDLASIRGDPRFSALRPPR
jgi:CubicO group peptidase (beta-lactamase class C family)